MLPVMKEKEVEGMKNGQALFGEQERSLVDVITGLPRKILRNHDVNGLTQMVLHDLGHQGGFGFTKATFLVDNPDFDHLIGVAGYNHDECCLHKPDVWANPESFTTDMADAHFHRDVRAVLNSSIRRKDINMNDSHDIELLGKALGLNDAHYFSWDMKHGNHGFFLYEKHEGICVWRDGLLQNVGALLGLCHMH